MQNLIVRYWKAGLVALCTPLAGHVYLALERPTLISGIPIDSNPLKWITASIAVGGFIFAGVRFFQSYRLAQLPAQGALAFGMAFLVETQIFMSAGRGWHLSWWEYHLTMLVGFLVCVSELLRQYRVTGDLGAIVEGLFLRQQVSGLRAGDPRALIALRAAIVAKDTETSGHIDRVSDSAVAVGEELSLRGDDLEIVRVAGHLHDLGKIGVPNSILGKTGPLTDKEFAIVKQHTVRGWYIADRSEMLARVAPIIRAHHEMLARVAPIIRAHHEMLARVAPIIRAHHERLARVAPIIRAHHERLARVAPIIRAHHERLDGAGYPDGLRAEFIPLAARIVAVADVWDAITSDRPYRAAMPWDEAAAILEAKAGSHLDPRCVQALFQRLGIPYSRVPYLKNSAG